MQYIWEIHRNSGFAILFVFLNSVVAIIACPLDSNVDLLYRINLVKSDF